MTAVNVRSCRADFQTVLSCFPAAHDGSCWSPPSPRLRVGSPWLRRPSGSSCHAHSFGLQFLNGSLGIFLRVDFLPVSLWCSGYLNLLSLLPVCGWLFHYITLF